MLHHIYKFKAVFKITILFTNLYFDCDGYNDYCVAMQEQSSALLVVVAVFLHSVARVYVAMVVGVEGFGPTATRAT